MIAANGSVFHDLDPRTGDTHYVFDARQGGGLTTSPAVVAGGVILWPRARRL